MTKVRQKGVRKVNEIKITVRETSGDHKGYIEWIEKFDFGNLPVEDRRTNKGRRKIFTKSPTETSRTRYGSALDWIFFTEMIVLTNFKWSSDTRRVKHFCSSLLPLFIGKRGRSLPPSSPSGGTSWKAQVGLVAICTPYLLNTPLPFFFADSFSVTLQNFTNFVTILVFLP